MLLVSQKTTWNLTRSPGTELPIPVSRQSYFRHTALRAHIGSLKVHPRSTHNGRAFSCLLLQVADSHITNYRCSTRASASSFSVSQEK